MARIEIWAPRYKDNTVLIDTRKVAPHNEIYFTKAKHLAGKYYYISGEDIRACPVQSNGRIGCYAVPMDKLELIKEYA